MVRRRSKSKETSIREQIACGSGIRIGSVNPGKVVQRRVKPAYVEGNLMNVKGPTSELLRMHRDPTKDEVKAGVKALARRLKKKPFSTWTAEEMSEAQKLLGPEAISLIVQGQAKAKQRR